MGPHVNVGSFMSKVTLLNDVSVDHGHDAKAGTGSMRSASPERTPYYSVAEDESDFGDLEHRLDQQQQQPGTPFARTQSPTNLTSACDEDAGPAVESSLFNAVDLLAAVHIAPSVQERIFRAVFNKYLPENSVTLNLTRFVKGLFGSLSSLLCLLTGLVDSQKNMGL